LWAPRGVWGVEPALPAHPFGAPIRRTGTSESGGLGDQGAPRRASPSPAPGVPRAVGTYRPLRRDTGSGSISREAGEPTAGATVRPAWLRRPDGSFLSRVRAWPFCPSPIRRRSNPPPQHRSPGPRPGSTEPTPWLLFLPDSPNACPQPAIRQRSREALLGACVRQPTGANIADAPEFTRDLARFRPAGQRTPDVGAAPGRGPLRIPGYGPPGGRPPGGPVGSTTPGGSSV
jgi:hypothetical protein